MDLHSLYWIFLSLYVPAVFLEGTDKCDVQASRRQSCGDHLTHYECRHRGCCHHPTGCYLSTLLTSEKCDISSGEKENCGYYGITMDACLIAGCCWQPTSVQGQPWCFTSKESSKKPHRSRRYAANRQVFFYWNATFGRLPNDDNAVYVTDDTGQRYYVGRLANSQLPGKVHPSDNVLYYARDKLEQRASQYEILQVSDAGQTEWRPASSGRTPDMAVIGGRTSDGRPLYVAYVMTPQGPHPGYLDAGQDCATVTWQGGASCLSDYHVLVTKCSHKYL